MIDDLPSFTVGGLAPDALAARWGTPLFVYDAALVRAGYRRIRDAFAYAPTRVHYAAVCNPNLHLLRLLRAEGAGIHANTPGDVYCALVAGFAPSDVVFSGSNLGDDDLAFLRDAGVHVNIDSLDDLGRACATPGLVELGLRVHLGDVLPESRVGLRERELDRALALARASGRRVTALHVYCGTHGRDVGRYRRAAAALSELAAGMPDVACVNLGGGFGYDYLDPEGSAFPFAEVGAAAGEALLALSQRLGRRLLLRAEPGRAMVAGSAVLLTRVRSVKLAVGRRYVGVDTTTANFTSPVVHGAHRRVVAVEPRAASDVPADVCGCTTFSRDFVAKDVALPEVRCGDLLAVLDAGAYGYCMSSHFLNRPRPAEVFVDAGVASLVTRRETFADLIGAQIDVGRDGAVSRDVLLFQE